LGRIREYMTAEVRKNRLLFHEAKVPADIPLRPARLRLALNLQYVNIKPVLINIY